MYYNIKYNVVIGEVIQKWMKFGTQMKLFTRMVMFYLKVTLVFLQRHLVSC